LKILAIKAIPVVFALAGAVAVALLLGVGPGVDVELRVPTEGEKPKLDAVVVAEGKLTLGDGEPSDLPGSWPCYRGSERDGVGREDVRLAREWPDGGPPVLWEVALGDGHAGAAVHAGSVYILDYDTAREEDALRCLSLADGREIWRWSYGVRIKQNHGMSRTVVAVTDDFVVALGPKGHVTCLDATSGELKWSIDLGAEYGTQVPLWYAAQCPLIEDGIAIIAPAGTDVLMMGVDCESGLVLWKTPNHRKWEMAHSSIVPMTFAGKRMYVYAGMNGVVGVSADDGTVLWESLAWRGRMAVAASPVVAGEGRVFVSAGYGVGAMMLGLREDKKMRKVIAEPIFTLEPGVFGSEQHSAVFYEGYIYGVRPNGDLCCVDTDGNVLWASGKRARFFKGYGPVIIADGIIIAMEPGSTRKPANLLRLIEATPDGYRPLAEARVLDGHDAWGPMALAGGRLIVRDFDNMRCLDLRAAGEK
jgi:outer membrane protein assembly factor BamB